MIPISTDDLKSGMILAKSVRNLQGLLLLNAGARLTAKNIRILKSWGVSELFIEGDAKGLMLERRASLGRIWQTTLRKP